MIIDRRAGCGSSTGSNSGALFGLLPQSAPIFAIVSLGVVGLIVVYHRRAGRGYLTTVALALLLGGAIGNLLDRLQFGYVVDWVDMGIGTWRFFTYNVADAAITTAIVLLIGDGDRAAAGRVGRGRNGRWLSARRRPPRTPTRSSRTRRTTCSRAPRTSSTTGSPRTSVLPPDAAPSIEPGPRTLVVPEGEIIRRVDRFVADRTGLSRSYVQKLTSEGLLTDQDGRRLRANSVLRGGSVTLEVPPAEIPYHLEPDPTIPIDVVYEDDDLLIVNKPSGLVVHPAPGHWQGTLVNALLARGDHYGGIAGVARPGIVHRLDRDTSGLLIVARNDAAQAGVMAQLKARRVRKTYLALAQGSVAAAVGRIEAPIGRDPKDRKRMAVVPNGRRSITGYRVRERFAGWTLLELDLVTGRTHQIRVHLTALGHPVAGDPVYGTGTSRKGPDGLERLFLHAWKLELVSPRTAKLVRAEAPLPDALEAVLEGLRAGEASAGRRPQGGVA